MVPRLPAATAGHHTKTHLEATTRRSPSRTAAALATATRQSVTTSTRRLSRSSERQPHRRIEALDIVCVAAWSNPARRSIVVEQKFDHREWSVSTVASISEGRSVAVRRPTNASRASIARQVNIQRARYASAVLGSLARSQQGRPTAQIQQLLRNSLTPLGVRLSSAKLHQLAADIAAGRPVALS
jgi:hypothetical protein